MNKYFKLTSACVAVLAFSTTAQAQNFQNWLNNETNKIQQEAGSGQITPGQAAQLQNRDAQIQSQEQQYLNQNGGVLTPQEQQKLNSETRHLNQHINEDAIRNNPGAVMPNGYYPPIGAPGQIPPQGWNPNYQSPSGQNPNYSEHHHHHHWDQNQNQNQNPYYNQYHN